ncbi:MAG: hypothetical protein ACKVI3_10625 [Verrucomicrobiia bacterium]
MANESEDPETYVAAVRLLGGGEFGKVKLLSGFKKGMHSVPDSVNAATEAFLGRLCAEELTDESEEWFQQARSELSYKRKEVTLDVTGSVAVLSAVDFVFEINYRLNNRDPGVYVKSTVLHQLKPERLGDERFETMFAGQFNEIIFDLIKGVSVEAVIDAVEELDGATGLAIEYRSDYARCTLTVKGIEAEVHCDGSSLSMEFPRAGGPSELVEAFAAVRHAFVISKNSVLDGLLG